MFMNINKLHNNKHQSWNHLVNFAYQFSISKQLFTANNIENCKTLLFSSLLLPLFVIIICKTMFLAYIVIGRLIKKQSIFFLSLLSFNFVEESIKYVEISTQTTALNNDHHQYINCISSNVNDNYSKAIEYSVASTTTPSSTKIPLAVDPLSAALKECSSGGNQQYNINSTISTTTTTSSNGKMSSDLQTTAVTNNNKLVSSAPQVVDSCSGSSSNCDPRTEVRFKLTPDAPPPTSLPSATTTTLTQSTQEKMPEQMVSENNLAHRNNGSENCMRQRNGNFIS